MPRLQALRQEQFLRNSDRSISSSSLTGGSSLKPISKAATMIHTLRIKKLKMPKVRI